MIAEQIISFWKKDLFHIGTNVFTPKTIVVLIASLTTLFVAASLIKKLLADKIFPKYKLSRGVSESIATIVRYSIVVVGLLIILQTSGLNLSAFGILFGALGIGIGFGLQNVSNNFISGLIILFERPIKVGDRVEVEGIAGNIIRISARATTIITNDNIAIIVPNSNFINSKVINWSLHDDKVRFNFAVGVSFNEDPEKVKKVLMEVALNCEGVLRDPAPDVLFDEFADNSLSFNLRVWSSEYADRPKMLKSLLYYAIFEQFKTHGIEIPYPQRVLHIKQADDNAELIKR